ncbi:unnamed protein product, partial [Strongylus vulgaris]
TEIEFIDVTLKRQCCGTALSVVVTVSSFVNPLKLYNVRCASHVGRKKGRSIMMLESSDEYTCMEVPSILHELFHVVGMTHEHMRHDRDRYIKVLYKNIDRSRLPSPFLN